MTQNLPQTEAARPRVLVVDDDTSVSKALARSIRQLGYEVLVAGGGEEGFEQALRAEPAVVLADVHMPGMDGHTLLRRLMRSGLQASVILMSGQGELDDAIGAFREGAIDYLKKPWTLPDLSTALARAMGLAGALRALTVSPRRATGMMPAVDATSAVEEVLPPLDATALVQHLADRAGGPVDTTGVTAAVGRPPRSIAVIMPGVAGVREVTAELSRALAARPMLGGALLRGISGWSAVPELVDERVSALSARAGQSEDDGRKTYEGVAQTLAALALHDAFPIGVSALQTLNDRIWRFSLARALAMRGIADVIDREAARDRHQWFLSGLMIDVGASWLLGQISAEMERRDSGVDDSARMNAAIATHHAAVGQAVLRRWNAPASWVALAGGTEVDVSALSPHFACAAILGGALAVRLCGFNDPSGDGDARSRSDGLARCAYTLGLGDTALRGLTKNLTESTELIWAAST